jgi:GNAT superfamily N-acetyltransferase
MDGDTPREELIFRVLTPPEIDVEATVAVLNAAFRRHAILGRDRTSLGELPHELVATSRVIQAFEANRLVGTLTVTPALDEPLEPHSFLGIDRERALHVSMAGVRPDRMGRGIGGRLLANADRIAGTGGYTHTILSTIREMGNVDYYARFGYQTVSIQELPAGYWGLVIPTHEHAMARTLTIAPEAEPNSPLPL